MPEAYGWVEEILMGRMGALGRRSRTPASVIRSQSAMKANTASALSVIRAGTNREDIRSMRDDENAHVLAELLLGGF